MRFHLLCADSIPEGGECELYADCQDAIPVQALAQGVLRKLLRPQDTFGGRPQDREQRVHELPPCLVFASRTV